MSKPIQTLLAAYVDNLVVAESLVDERVPVMDRPAMESRLRGSFFFFSIKKGEASSATPPGDFSASKNGCVSLSKYDEKTATPF